MKKIFIIFALIFTSISVSQARTYYFQDLNELVNAPDNEVFCDVETGNCNYDTSLDVELSFVEESTYLDLGVDASIPYTISGADKDNVTLSITSDDEEVMTSANMTVDTDNNTITIAPENVNKSGEVRIILTATNSEGGVVAQTYTYLDIATISSKNMLTLWTVEAGETVKFPFNDTYFFYKYDGHVDWGDDSGIETFENTKIQDLSHTYAEAGTYEIRIDGDFYKEKDFSQMFTQQIIPEGMDISQWDVSHVRDMQAIFSGTNLESNLKISNWDMSNVKNISIMFYGINAPEGLDLSSWDVSSATNVGGIFYKASILGYLNLSGWNLQNIGTTRYLFDDQSTFSGNIIYNKHVSEPVYSKFLQVFSNPSSSLPDTSESKIFAGDNACNSDDTECIIARNALIAKGWTIEDATVVTNLNVNKDTALESRWTVSAGETISFPVYPSYNGIIDWGDGTVEEFDDLKSTTHTYAEAGTYTTWMNGSWGDNLTFMFEDATIPVNLDISNWNMLNIKSAEFLFYNATIPEGFDISSWDVSNLYNLNGWFQGTKIPEGFDINSWNVLNIPDIQVTFVNTDLPSDFNISDWDLSGTSNIYGLLADLSISPNLDITKWDISNVTCVILLFSKSTIPDKFKLNNLDFSNVRDSIRMFEYTNILGDLVYDSLVNPYVYSAFVKVLADDKSLFPDSTTGQKIYVGDNTCAEDDTNCLSAEEKLANKGWVITRTPAN